MDLPICDIDRRHMARALALAERGLGHVEPNPLVGAVVAAGDQVIAAGWHERCGGPHAEAVALPLAGAAVRGATLYVTLEPCCHWGRTPPCTNAIIAAGISRVVAAMTDPFPQVAGRGFEKLRAAASPYRSACWKPRRAVSMPRSSNAIPSGDPTSPPSGP